MHVMSLEQYAVTIAPIELIVLLIDHSLLCNVQLCCILGLTVCISHKGGLVVISCKAVTYTMLLIYHIILPFRFGIFIHGVLV